MQRLLSFWRGGIVGKIILGVGGVVSLLLVCCVVSVIFSLVNSAGQSLGIIPTSTITPIPSATPLPTAIPTDAPTATEAPTSTPRPTRTPVPTETLIPTFTPESTIATDRAGIEPVDGECAYPYYIKISRNGLAHSISSRSYKQTNAIHCYATMKDANDAGYEEAGD